jgi:hypothetical protein
MPCQSVGHNQSHSASPIVGHVRERFSLTLQDKPVLPQPVSSASPSPSEVFIEDKERIKRVACRKSAYNEAACGSLAKINQAIPACDVLDFDPKEETELVTIEKELSKKLKPHKIKGVNFMWTACALNPLRETKGILVSVASRPYCMFLDKSLQIVTLVHTVLTNKACQVPS